MPLLLLACIAEPPKGGDTAAPPDEVAGEDDHFYDDSDTGSPADTGAASSGPVTYELGGTLYVVALKDPDTLGADYAHDHVVRATNWEGTATWDLDEPADCAASITVPVDDLAVDEDEMRALAGLSGTLSASDRSEIRDSMLASDQLDEAAYPEITFSLDACDAASGPTTLQGSLGLHGRTREVTVDATVSADASAFLATGQLEFLGSDYGIEPYSAYFGAVALLDEITLVFSLEGEAEGATAR